MTPHDSSLLSEYTQGEQRVLEEAHAPVCEHRRSTVLHRDSGGLDDHDTTYMQCAVCGSYFVVTYFARGAVTQRPMTTKEIAQWA